MVSQLARHTCAAGHTSAAGPLRWSVGLGRPGPGSPGLGTRPSSSLVATCQSSGPQPSSSSSAGRSTSTLVDASRSGERAYKRESDRMFYCKGCRLPFPFERVGVPATTPFSRHEPDRWLYVHEYLSSWRCPDCLPKAPPGQELAAGERLPPTVALPPCGTSWTALQHLILIWPESSPYPLCRFHRQARRAYPLPPGPAMALRPWMAKGLIAARMADG